MPAPSKRRSPARVWAAGAVLLLVGLLVVRSMTASGSGSDDGDGENESAGTVGRSTTTTTTTRPAGTTVTVTTLPTTVAPPAPSTIPGLTASGVNQALTGRGAYCGQSPDQPSPGHVQWACVLPESYGSVTVFATPNDEAVFVEVVDWSIDKQWAEAVASLPPGGPDAASAHEWVQGLITAPSFEPSEALDQRSSSETFAGVTYRLNYQPWGLRELTLEIGQQPPGA